MSETKQLKILNFIQTHANCSSGEIHKVFIASISYATVKRILSQLLTEKYIITEGKGTRYFISQSYELLYSIDLNSYFEKEIDERQIKEDFNFDIFEILDKSEILTEIELSKLADLQ
jgi:predicted transcriptional regulator